MPMVTEPVAVAIAGASSRIAGPGSAAEAPSAACAAATVVASNAALGRIGRDNGSPPPAAIDGDDAAGIPGGRFEKGEVGAGWALEPPASCSNPAANKRRRLRSMPSGSTPPMYMRRFY
jgi:hypothetical protein